MSFTRRSFLLRAGSGLSLLLLTACTPPETPPTPTSSPPPTSAVPTPSAFRRSNWSADPFARGSHSFAAVGAGPETREALASPLLDRVFFAGEATSVDYPGTVLGARESGVRAANEVSVASDNNEKIAVIGAGAAGAEAGRLLSFYGYDVVMIDARDRTGGRIHSLVSDDWPIPVELGAWRFSESADADILVKLDALGVDTALIGSPTLVPANGSADNGGAGDGGAGNDGTGDDGAANAGEASLVPDNTVGTTALSAALSWAATQVSDVSLQDALDGSGATEGASGSSIGDLAGADLLGQQLAAVAASYGAAASDLSSWYGFTPPAAGLPIIGQDGTVEAPQPQYAVTGDLSALVDDSLDGLETFLSTTVVGISYSDDGVSLRLGTGESLSVDRVVVTVPIGVLQSNDLSFDPLLPFAHRTAISALGVGTVDSIWLKFDEQFWTTDAAVWSIVGGDGDIVTWYNLLPLTGEPILVGVFGGAAALRLAELSDDELVETALQNLEPFLSA
jgi:monoamine oxidase